MGDGAYAKGLDADGELLCMPPMLGMEGVDRILADEVDHPPDDFGLCVRSEALVDAIRRLPAVLGRCVALEAIDRFGDAIVGEAKTGLG